MCFDSPPPRNVAFFRRKLLLDNSVSFTARMKDLCEKMEGKTIFSRRLQAAIGTVECLEVVDVGCNLKWFDGLTRLTLAPFPIFYEIYLPRWICLVNGFVQEGYYVQRLAAQIPYYTPAIEFAFFRHSFIYFIAIK